MMPSPQGVVKEATLSLIELQLGATLGQMALQQWRINDDDRDVDDAVIVLPDCLSGRQAGTRNAKNRVKSSVLISVCARTKRNPTSGGALNMAIL